MPSRSSTSSSDRDPPAFVPPLRRVMHSALPLVLAGIVALEWTAGRVLRPRAFSHEVDALLYELDTQPLDGDVLILGDSVAYNILTGWRDLPERCVARPTNQAVEMVGQYYLVERYLAHNPAPHAVVFLGHSPFYGGLKQCFTENYVQRCFTRWHELGEIAWAKRNPVFGFKMLLYRLMPTLKYRLQLQRALWRRSNADIYTGQGRGKTAANSEAHTSHDLLANLAEWLQDQRPRKINTEYFERLLDLLRQRGIAFYYVPAPLSETAYREHKDTSIARLVSTLNELAPRHPNLRYMGDMQYVYPDAFFFDGTHFRRGRCEDVRAKLKTFLERLASE